MATSEAYIRVARDTDANWDAGRIPAAGEPTYETDTKLFRIGDGVKRNDQLDAAAFVDGATKQLGASVRARIAANIADPTTPEGAAAAKVIGLPGPAGGVAIETLDPSWGWAWAAFYQDTREVAYGQHTDGSYYPAQDNSGITPVQLTSDQGWLFAVYYADTREIQYGVRNDGTVYPAPAKAAVRTVMVGDSLTQNWTSYLGPVATAIGHPVDNIGIGGQGALSIAARYGGAPARVAVDVVIPASGSVGMTLSIGPFSDTTTAFPVTVSGVRGTFVAASSSDNYRSGTFTRAAAGTPTKVWSGTPVLSRLDYRSSWPVFGMGRNGYNADGAIPGIVAAIQGCLDWAAPDARAHALVWSIPPFAGEENGTTLRATLDAANAAIRDAFPTRWVDFAGYLRSVEALQSVGVTPTSQDLTDISNGMTPTTFRTQANGGVDAGHFGPTGYAALNLRLIAEYTSRDWIA